MNVSQLHYKESVGIWRHIRMLFSLYGPILKPSFIIFAIYPFVIYVLAVALKTRAETYMMQAIIDLVITLNLCLSPILLTKRDFRDICAQLPVNAFEKLAFLLLNFWLLVPTIIFVSLFIGQIVGSAWFGINIPIDFFGVVNGTDIFGGAKYLVWWWILIASIVSVVLYFVVTFKKDRARFSTIAFIILYLIFTFTDYFCYVLVEEHNLMGDGSKPSLMAYCITEIVMALIGFVFLIKLYKKLPHSGF